MFRSKSGNVSKEILKRTFLSNLLNRSLFFKRDLLNEFDRFPNVT